MKKTKLLLGLCALSLLGKAQYNGMSLYSHSGRDAILSSGNLTNINSPGFLMGGYDPMTIGGGAYNLFIDKVDDQTLFSGTTTFQQSYQVIATATCAAPSAQLLTCHGLSVIETTGSPHEYMMTAAFDEGFIISGLNSSGIPAVPSYFFIYPPSSNSPSKPLIVESVINPDYYYVATSYHDASTNRRHMWVVLVDGTGTVHWSRRYQLTNNTSLEPNAIIESPFSLNPELVIVGTADPNDTTLGEEGFFVKINGNPNTGGGVIQFQFIGSSSASDERFYSLATVTNPLTNTGFLIGGYTNNSAIPGTSWMLLLDPFVSTVVWSSQIEPTSDPGGPVTGILYRNSPTLGDQFYGVARSAAGSIVLKLEAMGNPFSSGNNEFLYNPTDPNISVPVAITDINVSGNTNEGIHIYGTDRNTITGSEYCIINAFYNGAAGNCTNVNPTQQLLTNVNGWTNGPNTLNTTPALTVVAGPGDCSNHMILDIPISDPAKRLCPITGTPTIPYTGDNTRTGILTDLAKQKENVSAVSLQPNPVQEMLTLRYTLSSQQPVKIEIFNALGQRVKAFDQPSQPGENQMNIDFSHLGVESGIYFIHTSIGQNTDKQKVIYQK
jgi:hypothetical protein